MKTNMFVFFLNSDTPLALLDPCQISPCGPNTECNKGACTCIEGYHGDPHLGCRPECVYNSDCPLDKGCQKNKCVNPCIGTCGLNADCVVTNHIPMCTCSKGMSGNAFVECRPTIGNKDSYYNIIMVCRIFS